jgi:membrane-associated HD superfamily phosphohydrolase
MLTARAPALVRFTRGDASRLAIATLVLTVAMTAILGIDILPDEPLLVSAGELAPRDIAAPRAIDFVSVVRTTEARAAARAAVEPQYDYTSENAIAIAEEQQLAFERRVARIDTTFAADLTADERSSLLETAVGNLSDVAATR